MSRMARFQPTRPPHMTFFQALSRTLFLAMGAMACTASVAQICTREYAPVCGQKAHQASPRTFSNRCTLDAARATWLSDGECPPASTPRPGSQTDAYGCKASAGYQWNEEMASCIRPWMSSAITLQVASRRRHCTGMIEMQCLQVRELMPGQPPQKWGPFWGEIAGFNHVPGKRYTLRVRKDKIENPPADAPNTRYTLLKVLP